MFDKSAIIYQCSPAASQQRLDKSSVCHVHVRVLSHYPGSRGLNEYFIIRDHFNLSYELTVVGTAPRRLLLFGYFWFIDPFTSWLPYALICNWYKGTLTKLFIKVWIYKWTVHHSDACGKTRCVWLCCCCSQTWDVWAGCDGSSVAFPKFGWQRCRLWSARRLNFLSQHRKHTLFWALF